MLIKSKETIYKGYKFRSRLEARWAIFFDALGIEWEYEPEGFVLPTGTSYLPDFYLPYFGCYFEVKRDHLECEPEGQEAIKKISSFASGENFAGLIAFGDPMQMNIQLFCQECDDDGGGDWDGRVFFAKKWSNGEICLFTDEGRDDAYFFAGCEYKKVIPVITKETLDKNKDDFKKYIFNCDIAKALIEARQVRFEYSERKG